MTNTIQTRQFIAKILYRTQVNTNNGVTHASPHYLQTHYMSTKIAQNKTTSKKACIMA